MSATSQHVTPFPQVGFVRLSQIIGAGKPLPISRTSFLMGVRAGIYPKPVKLGPRTTAWRVQDIVALIDSLGSQAGGE
ncbi:AlpA family phage regulatory protein [Desulfovibrio sp. OttesenSCG-928-M16]|nr:AlpA family phage regulatory protein [Desulfovibrio sp. OttesenSCG-928-M16]